MTIKEDLGLIQKGRHVEDKGRDIKEPPREPLQAGRVIYDIDIPSSSIFYYFSSCRMFIMRISYFILRVME